MSTKTIETIKHNDASRKNIPTAEYQSAMRDDEKDSIRVAYERGNRELDPQLVWRGKDEQDCSNLIAQARPLHPGKSPPQPPIKFGISCDGNLVQFN